MNILIVEDEKSLRVSLTDELKDAGFNVDATDSGENALTLLDKNTYELVICDLVMENISGVDVLHYIKEAKIESEFVLITANGTLESAIEVLKKGALDYLCKPFKIEELLHIIQNVKETIQLKRENEELRARLYKRNRFEHIIGKSAGMQKVFDLMEIVSENDATVLIVGETGTGKEIVAEAIHYNGKRKDKPFIAVSCASLSKELLESELFGHEKGSFTGAVKQKKGRFELAHGGTLFLDEVDDIPLETQVKLLRVIETGKFERVGGEQTLEANVRIVAATKKNLYEDVEAGSFRKDLYYRLNVIQIHLPSLRERKEDIPLLSEYFLRNYSPNRPLELSRDILDIFLKYDWDGNVRELEHVIERLVLLQRDGKIEKFHLPTNILHNNGYADAFEWGKTSLADHLYTLERQKLVEALARCDGSKLRASELLFIPLPTLKSKLKKYDLN